MENTTINIQSGKYFVEFNAEWLKEKDWEKYFTFHLGDREDNFSIYLAKDDISKVIKLLILLEKRIDIELQNLNETS
jgi:hypothetical protein